jgi:hypothetical protein
LHPHWPAAEKLPVFNHTQSWQLKSYQFLLSPHWLLKSYQFHTHPRLAAEKLPFFTLTLLWLLKSCQFLLHLLLDAEKLSVLLTAPTLAGG